MAKLYSYVVDHDLGFAPNPNGGFCSLAKCKFASTAEDGSVGPKNIIELADKDDWIAGTGGANLRKSAGHGKLIYAMKVTDKITLQDYYDRYNDARCDADPKKHDAAYRWALISDHFYYFGRDAIAISKLPHRHLTHPFEKAGPGFRHDFDEEFINDFVGWLAANYKVGVHGEPCAPHEETDCKDFRCAPKQNDCQA